MIDDNTNLIEACKNKDYELANLLLENGADVNININDNNGYCFNMGLYL